MKNDTPAEPNRVLFDVRAAEKLEKPRESGILAPKPGKNAHGSTTFVGWTDSALQLQGDHRLPWVESLCGKATVSDGFLSKEPSKNN